MKIQVNSDNTIAVDATLTRSIEGEVSRILSRFAMRLTRVEVHLSDVDNRKMGREDKRCLLEVRPTGARPLSTSARAARVSTAVGGALGKMQRSLTTFFGRKGRAAVAVHAPVSAARKTKVEKPANGARTASAVKKRTALSPRGPKKKGIYQARRKSWPAR